MSICLKKRCCEPKKCIHCRPLMSLYWEKILYSACQNCALRLYITCSVTQVLRSFSCIHDICLDKAAGCLLGSSTCPSVSKCIVRCITDEAFELRSCSTALLPWSAVALAHELTQYRPHLEDRVHVHTDDGKFSSSVGQRARDVCACGLHLGTWDPIMQQTHSDDSKSHHVRTVVLLESDKLYIQLGNACACSP